MDNKGVQISVGFGWIFLAIMIVMFLRSPDLHDALIFNLAGGDMDGRLLNRRKGWIEP